VAGFSLEIEPLHESQSPSPLCARRVHKGSRLKMSKAGWQNLLTASRG